MLSQCSKPTPNRALSASLASPPRLSRRRSICVAAAKKGGNSNKNPFGDSPPPNKNDNNKGKSTKPPSKPPSAQQAKFKKPPAPPVFLTPPIESSVTSILTPYERLPRPLWSTFCGSCSGVWRGSYVAFNPANGKLEPMALDDAKNKVILLKTLTTETRCKTDTHEDALLREERAGRTLSAAFEANTEETTRRDEMTDEEDGLVAFEDGSYSRGPVQLGVPVSLEELDLNVASTPVSGGEEGEEEQGGERIIYIGFDQEDDEDEEEEEDGEEEEEEEEEEEAELAEGKLTRLGDVRFEDADDETEDEEDEEGLVIDEDGMVEMDGEQAATCVIEQVLTMGGHGRVRVALTLAVAGGGVVEMDIGVLRLTCHYEEWVGPKEQAMSELRRELEVVTTEVGGSGSASAAVAVGGRGREMRSGERVIELSANATAPTEIDSLRKMHPRDLQDSWRVFTVGAVPISEKLLAKRQLVFTSMETEEKWKSRGTSIDSDEDMDGGAMMWLPGQIFVGIRMVPEMSPETSSSASSLASSPPSSIPTDMLSSPRGVSISLGWMFDDVTLVMMERDYDSSGVLKEVRCRSAVKGEGGWSGGRM